MNDELKTKCLLFRVHRSASIVSCDEAVADVDHRFDMEVERREAAAQAIDVDVEALGVEGDGGRPRMLPDFCGRDDALRIARQAREDQKLFARKLERVLAARDIIVVVLDAQTPVVIDIRVRFKLTCRR